ncbi:choline ethanolaminephosphotransferase [Lentinula boryana]|uniref:Choline ethanolaminephosphotransferase n=1 Tax=Lentinula boryana TaxID=40481 RepID=A0ABQ8QPF6_9AGAR|nr:choline ethanolaminephosphotransferase [Lentinula boryana]
MGYLSDEALQNLKKYAYKGVDKSILSKWIMNAFWSWFVTLWPLSVAPNTITLSGLCIVILNFITLLYYDPSYVTEKGGAHVPQWIYFTWGIGLFLYQSFDAVDGKQARRTGMAGPLGEMFDHGCDALNTTLEAIIAAQALNLGQSWWTLASQVAALGNFYITTWEEYHTGFLFLGVCSGPVEGILMLVVVYLITGIYGPSFWDTGILDFLHLSNISLIANTIPNIGLNVAFMVFGAFGLAFNIIASYSNVRTAMRKSGKSTTKPLLLLLPFLFSAGMQIAWLAHPKLNYTADAAASTGGVFKVHSPSFLPSPSPSPPSLLLSDDEGFTILCSSLFVPFLCAWGLQFAHQVGRMILAHLTKGSFPLWDWLWVMSVVGAIDANLPRILGIPPIIQSTPHFTAVFVYATLVFSFVAYARFCTLVINDITNFMGIACFTVRKKDKEGRWRSVLEETPEAVEGRKER